VPEAAAHVAPYLDLPANSLALFSTAETKAVNARQEIDRRSRMTGHGDRLSERLCDLDDMGLDIQVAMPSPLQRYYIVPIDIGVKAVRS